MYGRAPGERCSSFSWQALSPDRHERRTQVYRLAISGLSSPGRKEVLSPAIPRFQPGWQIPSHADPCTFTRYSQVLPLPDGSLPPAKVSARTGWASWPVPGIGSSSGCPGNTGAAEERYAGACRQKTGGPWKRTKKAPPIWSWLSVHMPVQYNDDDRWTEM